MGLRLEWLGTELLSWRDLLVIVHQSPADSAIARTLSPDLMWGLPEHLLAAMYDTLRVLVWQNTKDGKRNRNRPEPLTRPGISSKDKTTLGNGSMSLDEAEAWLAKRNPNQHRRG